MPVLARCFVGPIDYPMSAYYAGVLHNIDKDVIRLMPFELGKKYIEEGTNGLVLEQYVVPKPVYIPKDTIVTIADLLDDTVIKVE